jgi:hypothetical protein
MPELADGTFKRTDLKEVAGLLGGAIDFLSNRRESPDAIGVSVGALFGFFGFGHDTTS